MKTHTQEKIPLHNVLVQTSLNAYYVLPDVTTEGLGQLVQQLRNPTELISISNISQALLTVPYRIISHIYTCAGLDMISKSDLLWSKEEK